MTDICTQVHTSALYRNLETLKLITELELPSGDLQSEMY